MSKKEKKKAFQNISHILDIYRLCTYKMENYVTHDKKNIKHSGIFYTDQIYTGYASIANVKRLNFGYLEALGCAKWG